MRQAPHQSQSPGSIYENSQNQHNNSPYNYNNRGNMPLSNYVGQGSRPSYPQNAHGHGISNHQVHTRPGYSSNQQQSLAANSSSTPVVKNDFYSSLPLHRPAISEVVMVPENLGVFAADPKFQTILLKVKEQSNINTVAVNRLDNVATSIFIDAPNVESALMARQLIEIHFKQQLKLLAAEEKLKRVENDLFLAQGEMASGHMVEFKIDPSLIGVIIGKKGARIKQIEQESGVTNIFVQGDSGVIKIVGTNASSVHRARELCELVEFVFPLTESQIDWYAREYNTQDNSLDDVKEVSNVNFIRFRREEHCLIIVGTKAAVQSAQILLNTQMEYIQRQMGIKSNELAAREKLYELKKQYGLPNNNNSNNRGGNGNGNGSGRFRSRDDSDINRRERGTDVPQSNRRRDMGRDSKGGNTDKRNPEQNADGKQQAQSRPNTSSDLKGSDKVTPNDVAVDVAVNSKVENNAGSKNNKPNKMTTKNNINTNTVTGPTEETPRNKSGGDVVVTPNTAVRNNSSNNNRKKKVDAVSANPNSEMLSKSIVNMSIADTATSQPAASANRAVDPVAEALEKRVRKRSNNKPPAVRVSESSGVESLPKAAETSTISSSKDTTGQASATETASSKLPSAKKEKLPKESNQNDKEVSSKKDSTSIKSMTLRDAKKLNAENQPSI